MSTASSRREFLSQISAGAALAMAGALSTAKATELAPKGERMAYGLVTYLWGQNWTLEELITNCEKSGVQGVELRTTHKHGVEPSLNEQQRIEVARRFADSDVTLVGIGSNERFDHPDEAALRQAIDASKAFIRLSHDVGGSGVKVKPDSFHENIPHEQTIEQIGKALIELGDYGEGFGQQVRLEVHGQCAQLPTIKAIMDVATHPNVFVCWNSNPQDLEGEGLAHNFQLVADRLGATCHVRELDNPMYPFAQLIKLLVDIDYEGYVMLESSTQPEDPVAALAAQVQLFKQLVQQAQS